MRGSREKSGGEWRARRKLAWLQRAGFLQAMAATLAGFLLCTCGGSSSSISAPVIASWSPRSVQAGSSGFTLTVNGSGFLSAAVIVNGQALPTLTVSDTKITADIPASLIATPGSVVFRVTDLTPGSNITSTGTGSVTAMGPVIAPDLAISKSHVGSFIQGQTGATYTLTIANVGSGPTSSAVTVTDSVPTGLTPTAISGSGWTCTLGTVSCTRSDALAGGLAYPPVTLTVDVAANALATVTNTASVATARDTNGANNSASDPTTVNPPAVPALALIKTHTGSFVQTQSGTYTLTVSDSGTGAPVGTVQVVDTLPTGLTASNMTGTGWTCNAGTLTCSRSDAIAAGASYPPITLDVDVAANAPASVTNSATASGGGSANSSTANDATTIQPYVPVLAITKFHVPTTFSIGGGGVYTITVSNSGTAPTSGQITVVDALPSNGILPVLTAVAMSGSGWACDILTVTCTTSTVFAAGANLPDITLTVDVSPLVSAQTVVNSATVSGGGSSSATATDPTPLQ
jgi:uncharacterized repeat protein (TIGR01451 family)